MSFAGNTQPVSINDEQIIRKFAWTVDTKGFEILKQYAYAKQECISDFQTKFLKEFRLGEQTDANK